MDFNYLKHLKSGESTQEDSLQGNAIPKLVPIPNHINIEVLKKAVYLNNFIFQFEKKPYIKMLLTHYEGEVIYYSPLSYKIILAMDARFNAACMIVYNAVTLNRNITATQMQELNNIYKKLKETYGS